MDPQKLPVELHPPQAEAKSLAAQQTTSRPDLDATLHSDPENGEALQHSNAFTKCMPVKYRLKKEVLTMGSFQAKSGFSSMKAAGLSRQVTA